MHRVLYQLSAYSLLTNDRQISSLSSFDISFRS